MLETIIFASLCVSFVVLAATRWMGYRTLLRLGREQRAYFDERREAAGEGSQAEPYGVAADGPESPCSTHFTLTEVPEVSVIVVSEGDGALLEANLPYVLRQFQQRVEVIVVDISTSGTHAAVSTSDALKRIRQRFPQLRQTYVPVTCRNVDRRQLGYTLGIRAARAPWVAFTEPDCVPESYEWLSQMVELARGDDADVVLGYCNYDIAEGTPGVRRAAFGRLKRFLYYSRAALNGRAVGADACNVLVRRQWFMECGGFVPTLQAPYDVVSLAVDAHVASGRTALALCPESVVRRQSPADGAEFATDRELQFRADRCRSFRGRRLMWREGIADVALWSFALSLVAYAVCRALHYVPDLPAEVAAWLPYEAAYRPFWLCMDVPALLLLAAACLFPVAVFRRITDMLGVPSFGAYPLCWHLWRPWRRMALRWRCRK